MLLVAALTGLAIWLVPTRHQAPVELPPMPTADTPAPSPATPAGTPAATPATTVAPADQDNSRGPAGSSARRFIAAQRSSGQPDPQAAYDEARQLAASGRPEDAWLLDFYAARLGHAGAAFDLAEQADPAHWQPGGALKTAAPEQALRWYRAAAEAGHPEAAARLAALHAWAETAARRGDSAAQRLMLAW